MTEHRLLGRLAPLDRLESRIAASSPLSPNALSASKLVMTALMGAVLIAPLGLDLSVSLSIGLFVCFAALDYLDGVVARGRDQSTRFGRILDRATDLPMLLLLGAFSVDVIPPGLVATKLILDVSLLALYVAGRGSTENRVRTTMSYSLLLGLLLMSQHPPLLTAPLVVAILWTNIAFNSVVLLFNLRVLRRSHFADVLSAANLACGVGVMLFASRGQLPLSLLCLAGSALFDGLDGLAARRWGGSRFGVLADDIADGVSYGLAPGVALAITLPGYAGTLVGAAFALFVVGRLVFFTLQKGKDDPERFRGAPSTVGALITLTSLHLFAGQPLLVGAFVGGAIAFMVSFDARYRHLGRALKSILPYAPLAVSLMVLSGLALGANGPVALLLLAGVGYGLTPTLRRFRGALGPHSRGH